MKKVYIFLWMLIASLLASGMLKAQNRVLVEGFETTNHGQIPNGWTQEPTSNVTKWAVETSNFTDPQTTYLGKGRIKFSSGENGEKAVKLITPQMDITRLSKPILVFNYAAVPFSGTSNSDSLKVYYRYAPTSNWVLAKSYGPSSIYIRDTIDFPSPTRQFQIAFEGVNKNARGVVLDEVLVTSRPNCAVATANSVFNVIHNHAKVRWTGSLEPNYVFKLSTTPLNNPSEYNDHVDTIRGRTYHELNNLTASTTYYYYIQSDCGYGDVSKWISGTFTTACEPTSDITTNFDADDAINCWYLYAQSHTEYKATLPTNKSTASVNMGTWDNVINSTPKSGKSLFFNVHAGFSGQTSAAYAVAPRLNDNVNLKEKELNFWLWSNVKAIKLHVALSEWPDDFVNVEHLGTISVRNANTYEKIRIVLENIETNGRYIIFYIDGRESSSSVQFPQVNIDDMQLIDFQPCDISTEVTSFSDPIFSSSGVTLKWNESGAVKWNIKVSENQINPSVNAGSVEDTTVESPEILVENLNSSSTYFYYVQPICEDGVKGAWSAEKILQTPCSETGISIPYKETFDKYDKETLPQCWSYLHDRTYIETNAKAISGGKYLYTYSYGNTHVVTPKISTDIKNLQISFYSSLPSIQVTLEVGVMTDPTDASTFKKVTTIYPYKAYTWDNWNWEKQLVKFNSYAGNGQYIALRYTGSSSYRIDDFVIEEISACSDPENVTTTASTNSITLNWQPAGDESSWDIAYGITGFSLTPNTSVVNTTTPSYTIPELNQNTTYDVYIRSICAGGAKGGWFGPFTVKTQVPASVPYFCNFEDDATANAWSFANGIAQNQWVIGEAANDDNNGNALYISNNFGATNAFSMIETYVYAYRTMNLNAGLHDFKFKWRQHNGNGSNNFRAFLVPVNVELIGGSYYNVFHSGLNNVPSDWIPVSGVLSNTTNNWTWFSAQHQLKETGTYNLVFAWISDSYDGDANNKPAAIDSISVDLNTTDCLTPEYLTISDIKQRSADLSFISYNATQWELKVSTTKLNLQTDIENATIADPNIVIVETISTNPYTITGLDIETIYYAYVKASCGGNWASVSFQTICEAVEMPLKIDFDELPLDSYMECWRRITGNSSSSSVMVQTVYPYDATQGTNDTHLLKISTGGSASTPNTSVIPSIAVTPELKPDVKALLMTFRATAPLDFSMKPHYAEVGIMNDPLDANTFTLIEKIPLLYAGQWKTYTTVFNEYDGDGKHIAIRLPYIPSYSATIYIDDIYIDSIKGCLAPKDVKAENITSTTANITWREVVAGSTYHVKVCTSPLGRWEDKGDVYDGLITGNQVAVSNMMPSRIHYVYVRTDCGNDSYSFNYTEADFKTICEDPATLPYYEYFELYDVNVEPDCWQTIRNAGGTHTIALNHTSWGKHIKSIGKASLAINSSTDQEGLVALPVFKDADIKDIKLSFKGMSPSSYSILIVGVISDLSDATTFTPVDTINLTSVNEWHDCTVYFDTYTGTGKNIAFFVRKGSMGGDTYYLDDLSVVLGSRSKCPDVSAITVTKVTSTTATIAWGDNENASTFEVKIADREINPELENGNIKQAYTVNTNSDDLSGLPVATKCYAYVRANCSNGNSYWSAPVVFTTDCDLTLTTPYSESFDTYGELTDNGYFPDCWRYRVKTYGEISPTDQPTPYIEDAVMKSLVLKAAYDSEDKSYAEVDVIAPRIGVLVQDHIMTFKMKSDLANTGILYVGLMRDPSDATTFVPYDTVTVSATNEWEEKTINFIDYPDDHKNIAFRISSSSAGRTYKVQITDIVVSERPDCMPPRKVYVKNGSKRTFISWAPGTEHDTKYYFISAYSWGDRKLQPPFTDSWFNDLAPEVVGSTTYPLHKESGVGTNSIIIRKQADVLAKGSNMRYLFALKTNDSSCEQFYPTQTVIANNVSCNINTLPYLMDFDDPEAGTIIGTTAPLYSAFPDCWERISNVVDENNETVYPYIGADETLYMSSTDTTSVQVVLPSISSSNLKASRMRFSANSEDAAQLNIYIGSYSSGAISETTLIKTVDITDKSEYMVKFDGYTGTKSYIIISMTGNHQVKLDDVLVEKIPDCYTPELSLVSRTTNSFSVKWSVNDKSPQSNWDLSYGPAGIDPEEGTIIQKSSTNHIFPNMLKNTSYDVYVRAYCDDNGEVTEWVKLSVTTLQTPAEYPYSTADFADANNWTLINANEVNQWSIGTAATEGAGSSLYISNDNGITHAYDTLSPSIVYAYRTIKIPAGPQKLSFDWKAGGKSGSDFLRVFLVPESIALESGKDYGIVTDTIIPNGWIEVGSEYSEKTSWTTENVNLYISHLIKEPMNLVFCWINSSKEGDGIPAAIKNIAFEISTECTTPEVLTAYQVTSSEATIDWISYNATQWYVKIFTSLPSDPASGGELLVVDQKPFVIKDGSHMNSYKLEPNTDYYFYVQSACNDFWSEGGHFKTLCTPQATLVETFDQMLPDCWRLYEGLASSVFADPTTLTATTSGWKASEALVLGGKHAKLSISGTNTAHWLVSPTITLTQESALSFDLALTAFESEAAIYDPKGQVDDQFMVLVSTDEGVTWNQANATVWNNKESGDYSFNKIATRGERIDVDLFDYTGKDVRIAFYAESTVARESNDLHIDSVRIDCRHKEEFNGEVCQGYRYMLNGFNITEEQTSKAGNFDFTRVVPSTTGGCDTTYVVHLTIKPVSYVDRVVNVCSNELPYSDKDFAGITTTGTYTSKQMVSANGCDSIIVLSLTVNQAYEYNRSLTIDYSDLPYEYECTTFGEKTKSGFYKIECTTAAGCDSIINLTLTVNNAPISLNSSEWNEFTLIPNPANRGEGVKVNYEFTPEELAGMKVEIFNASSVCLMVQYPTNNPVTLTGLNESGVYFVQITTGTNIKLYGKVIIK